MFCRIGNQFNQMIGAGCHTFTAGNTFFLIYNSNAVHNMNRIKSTGLYAGAITHTSVGAGLFAGAGNYRNLGTVVNTKVIVLYTGFVAGTFTFYKGNLLLGRAAFNTHNCSNLLSYSRTAYRAGIDSCSSGSNRACQTVTSRESAAAAVVARQFCTNQDFFLIYLYF